MIVCEGQPDTIACHLAGTENTVAPQGTALTADHARILKRYAEVVLCFDLTAGQQAATSLTTYLPAASPSEWRSFRSRTTPTVSSGNGAESFRKLIDDAPGFFDFLINYLPDSRRDSDRGRVNIVKAMREAVQKTNNPVLIDTYAQKSATGWVAADAVRTEFAKRKRTFQRVEQELAEEEISIPEDELPLPKRARWSFGCSSWRCSARRRSSGSSRTSTCNGLGTMGCGKFYSNTSHSSLKTPTQGCQNYSPCCRRSRSENWRPRLWSMAATSRIPTGS